MTAWTIVLFRTAGADPAVEQYESELLESLRQSASPVLSLPDLYHLPVAGAGWELLQSVTGPLLVVARRYPRALFWLLQVAGVAGRRADQQAAPDADRPLYCLDMRSYCCPEKVMEKIGAVIGVAATAGTEAVQLVAGDAPPRWYPVLDYDRCHQCLECAEFCLFGVFEIAADGRPVVAAPERCKDGCPACSRVCPAAAIMFPDYYQVAAIAGADTGEIPAFKVEDLDLSQVPTECASAVQKHLAAGGACACAGGDCGKKDIKDDPITRALDQLDDEDL